MKKISINSIAQHLGIYMPKLIFKKKQILSIKIFRNLIANCLRKNPNERATATQLLRHEFLDMAKVNKN